MGPEWWILNPLNILLRIQLFENRKTLQSVTKAQAGPGQSGPVRSRSGFDELSPGIRKSEPIPPLIISINLPLDYQ